MIDELIMSPTVDKTGGGVPKWLLGLAIGVPVAAGIAYVLFGGTSRPKDKKDSEKASPKKEASQMKDPLKQAVAHKDKGNEYFFQGRYELAIKSYSDAISVCPTDQLRDLSIFHQNRAAAYEQLGKLDCVVSDCDVALSYAGNYVKALDRRSKAVHHLVDKESKTEVKIELLVKCLEDYTALNLLSSFKSQEHMLALDSLLIELGTLEAQRYVKKPLFPTKMMVKSFFSYFIKDPCLKMSLDVQNGNITNGHGLSGFEKALDAFENEEYGSIVSFCTEELTNPKSVHILQAKLLRSTICVITKDVEQAFNDLTDIINDDKVDLYYQVNALIKRSHIFINRLKDPLDPESSFADLQRAEELQPDNPDVYHHRGKHHLLIGNLDMAIRDFNKALEIGPDSPILKAQMNAAILRKCLSQGNMLGVDDCISAFQKLIEEYPNCSECHTLYAQALSGGQEFDKSIAIFKKAIAIEPKDPLLYVQQAIVLLDQQGDIENATTLINKALEIDSSCHIAYEHLALIEMRAGNHEKALKLFDKAISSSPVELDLVHHFGQKYGCMTQAKVGKRLGYFQAKNSFNWFSQMV
nr:LOW QUALITY PROTEIN: mitochondrial import receptor subunit TOM70-like [Lepeophtheirus salmonis]